MASTSPSKTLFSYYALACGISWLLWVPLYLGPEGLGLIRTNLPDSFSVFSGKISLSTWLVAGSLGPTVAALIAQRISRGRFTGFRLWTSLLPMAAEAADMTFQDVVTRIIEAALARRESGT